MARSEREMSVGPCRHLILMRHAKSDWGDNSLSDHDRPLNRRGMEDAPRIAAWLEEQDLIPDQIICSSAERTRETVELMLSAWSQQPDWSSDESLYLAPPEAIVSVIRSGFAGSRILMLVGHNPGWEVTASLLSGQSLSMTTANVACLTHPESDWSGIFQPGTWTLTRLIRPKEL